MMAGCEVIPTPDQLASGLMAFVDCQAQTLGARGFAALAASGSSVSIMIGTMLTIFIALFGYRLLLGDTPGLRELVIAIVKLGVVLAFTTSWPAYQAVVYDVALRAPGELAAEIGSSAGLPASTAELPTRLDQVDQALRALTIEGVGVPTASQAARYEPPLWIGFDAFALGATRVVFIGTAIGGFALTRLAAGLLLALGPLFLAFLLFDGTRGLFEGWARALIGAALGGLATAILLGIELSLLGPWVADLLARRAAGYAIVGVPAPLFATTMIFAVVLAGLLFVTARLAAALRLPSPRRPNVDDRRTDEPSPWQTILTPTVPRAVGSPPEPRSRALAIGDAIAAVQRREEAATLAAASAGRHGRGGTERPDGSAMPLSQSFRRRTTQRVSASRRRRDARR